jgi:hypothetical protein
MNETPIRIYCGAARDARLPFEVLAHSIRRHTPHPVEIHAIDNGSAPLPADPRHAPYTQFSFARFAIPALAGYQGRAVYMDSDMLVFRDFAELWQLPFDGAKVLIEIGSRDQRDRGKHTAVMLLDCARLEWRVDEIVADLGRRYDYNDLMAVDPLLARGEMLERIPTGWNDLDRFDPERTRNLHYTEIRTQPWVTAGHPLGHLWTAELKRAIDAGAISTDMVREEIAAGYARPSLAIELGLDQAPGTPAADARALAEHDRRLGYVAHRALLERFVARKRAIRAFERDRGIARRPWLAPWYRLQFSLRERH